MAVTIIDVVIAGLLLSSTWLLRDYCYHRRGCCVTIVVIDVVVAMAVAIINVVVARL